MWLKFSRPRGKARFSCVLFLMFKSILELLHALQCRSTLILTIQQTRLSLPNTEGLLFQEEDILERKCH